MSFIATHRALACLAGLLTCCALIQSAATAAAPASVPISEAPELEWGVKESWRTYVGPPASAGDGARVIPTGPGSRHQIGWEFDSGSYDPADGTTVLQYTGTVHWLKYPGTAFPGLKPPSYEGPMDVHILDVTLSDPVVTISPTGSTIAAEVASRSTATWEVVHFDSARVAELDVGGIEPVVADGTTTWTGIPTFSGADAEGVFAGNYREGTAFDALSFAYTGPGGAPDLSDRWDEPGSSPLALEANTILTDNGVDLQFRPWLLDREQRLIYFTRSNSATSPTGSLFQAFSLDDMEPLGEPLETLFGTPENPVNLAFYDSNTGRLFFNTNDGQLRWVKYDVEAGEWLQEAVAQPFPLVGELNLIWDSVGERAFNFVRHVPEGVASGDYDNHQWQLNTYTEQPDGSWQRQAYDLPNGPLGLNRDRYPLLSSLNAPSGLAAPDGSLIVVGTRQRSNNPGVPAPATVPGAYRIVLDEASGTAQAEPIAGTEVNNAPNNLFSQVLAGQGNQVVLTRENIASFSPKLQAVTIPGPASPAVAGPLVTVAGLEAAGPTSFAVDREDGTVWIGGNWSQRITGVRDGRVVASQFFPERHPRGGPVMVGQGHTVYAQTNDGSPADFGGSAFYGMGRFARLGISPEVTLDPAPQTTSLGIGEETEPVSFESAASGEPEPSRQWQVKAPDDASFANIAGETGATLTIDTERGMDGTQYRAVYQNAAGRIGSEAATLAVEYAPQIATDAVDVAVTEGSEAFFSVLADANPIPVVTWQRRVSGFWEPIAPGDENFLVDGSSLTVLDTNTEQSGTLFRAKATNPVGHAYSRNAKLTVTPSTEIPAEGLDLEQVSLEWTGNEELQGVPPAGGSNYFSAGVSKGNEATYRSVDGDAAVFQVAASGGESLATWATRAAHIAGGGEQLVRLYGGDARIEPDGSATVRWDGSWSVNFYGGLAPFTFTDPELSIDADGAGTLRAEMSGCASSIANPIECAPLAPVSDVTVATFSGVEIDPSGEVGIDPDYAGVEIEGDPTKPQLRTGAGWGAWPQPFVSFHVQTGLSGYWYSSGSGFDAKKSPAPFTVDFQGELPPSGPPPGDPPLGEGPRDDTPQSQTPAPSGPAPLAKPVQLAAFKRTQPLGGKRTARLVTFSCPEGAACKVSAPPRLRLKLGGKRYELHVLAPKRIGAGQAAALRLRFPKPALKALGERKRATTVELRLRAGGQTYRVRATLRRVGKGRVSLVHVGTRKIGKGGDTGLPTGVVSAPISGDPELLRRPPTAVDVSGVQIVWHPRDSWLRYASSGVAAGDGIQIGNGASGTNSASSACPDRASTSDAQLPHAISFTPKASWYDPPSGIAAIHGQGSVGFRWKAHAIDLTASDPEIEISGSASRAIFRFSGSEGTPYPDQRADLLSLDTAGRPTVTNGGKTLTYDLMRGRLTANGVNVFAGFYAPPNDQFGCFSVSFTIP